VRPVEFGEALPAGTRLTLFSDDKPERFFTVIKFWMDETSGVALTLAFAGPRLRRLTFNRRKTSQSSQAIHTMTCGALT
jgi:uncharacterized protein (DUF2249 family)